MNVLACLNNVVLPKAVAEKEAILPLLLAMAQDSKDEVRMVAFVGMGFYDNQANRVIPILTKALTDLDPDVRVRAAMSLCKVDPAVAANAGALSVLFDSRRWNTRFGAPRLAEEFLRKTGKLDKNESN
jgi:HEAT repeat protein